MKILLFAITLIFTLLRPSDAFTHPYHNINSFTTTQSQSQQQQYTPTTNRNLIITSAATLDGSPSSYEMSDFAKRMKNIIRKEEKQRNTKKRTTKSNNAAPKNLLRIKTLSDFKKVVGDEKERLVVVRWYAPWCKVRVKTYIEISIIDSVHFGVKMPYIVPFSSAFDSFFSRRLDVEAWGVIRIFRFGHLFLL